ncbi:MAG: hypothetical protein ABH859_02940 [Pseudomonadota bacterium]
MAIETVVSKLSTQALDKAVNKTAGSGQPLAGQNSFQDVLNNVDAGRDFAEQLGIGQDIMSRTVDMKSLGANQIDFTPDQAATGIGQPETGKKVLDMLSVVNNGQIQMDSLVNNILYSDKKFSNQELLCIQAHVFHYAQMTELTVKIAEQGVSSVKSVLNTQVQ